MKDPTIDELEATRARALECAAALPAAAARLRETSRRHAQAAEQAARAVRGSRPDMPAVRPPAARDATAPAAGAPAQVADEADRQDITGLFEAIRDKS